jgi:hypothetical protein
MALAADPTPEVVKKLGSVTWDLESHKLTWVVQKGVNVNGAFTAQSEEKYSISPDQALMSLAEEQREFNQDEAVTLHHLLDILSIYCAESVVWWDEGQGTPPGSGSKTSTPAMKPARPEKTDKTDKAKPEQKPVKVGEPQQKKNSNYRVADTDMVAMNH